MKLRSLYSALFLLALLPAADIPSQTKTERKPSGALETLLPADTFLFGRVSSLHAAWKGFQTLPLYEIWEDEEVQEFVLASREKLEKEVKGKAFDIIRFIGKVYSAFDGEISFALLSPAEGGNWILCMESREDPARAERFLREVFQPLLKKGNSYLETGRTPWGEILLTQRTPETDYYAFTRKGRFYFVRSKTALEIAMGGKESPAGSLSGDPRFLKTLSRLQAGGDTSFFLYLNLEPEWARARKKAEKRPGRKKSLEALDESGLTGLHSLGAALTMKDSLAWDRIWLDFPPGPEGFAGAFPGGPADPATARLAPKNAYFFVTIRVKPGPFFQAFRVLWKGGSQGGAADPGERAKEKALFQAISDILGCLGSEVVVYSSFPRGGGLFPEAAMAVEVMEPDKLLADLESLIRTEGKLEVRRLRYKNRIIHYVRAGNGGLGVPCWCVTDGYLLASYATLNLKSLIRRLDGKAPNLAGTKEFREAWKNLPAGATGAAYLNTNLLFGYLYNLLVPLASAAGSALPFDPSALPSAEAITSHLSFGLSALVKEKDGWKIETRSDGIGPTSFLAFGFLPFLSVSAVSMGGEALSTVQDSCAFHLRYAFQDLSEYRRGHGGYPPRLADVGRGNQSRGPWWADCPAADKKRKAKEKGKTGKKEEGGPHLEDFTYVVQALGLDPPPAELPPEAPLVWDSAPRHNGGRFLVTAGGKVKWLYEKQFQKMLKTWKEKLK